MDFEYDPAKSAANKRKHGIGFVEAQALWDDDDRIEVDVISTTEPRCIVIGKIGKKFWTAVITYRDDKVRLISVRRSRKQEVTHYEKNLGD